jgi:chemotaxis protein CheC
MTLTHLQRDALTELVNIAFGLTAAKLSEISSQRVVLAAPTVVVHPIDALARELGAFLAGELATVHQVFSGPVSGDAMLFLNYDGAITLSNLLIEEQLRSQRFDSSTGEILTEVGNMLLSACLGMFGNLLQVHVTFSVPRLHLESLEQFLASMSIGGGELRYAVVITASFNIREQGIDGRIVIVLGVSSLERLIQAVERWESGGAGQY